MKAGFTFSLPLPSDLLSFPLHFAVYNPSQPFPLAPSSLLRPAHALHFAVYELSKEYLGGNAGSGHHPLIAGFSGILATVVNEGIMTPADVVKQRLQVREVWGRCEEGCGMWDVVNDSSPPSSLPNIHLAHPYPSPPSSRYYSHSLSPLPAQVAHSPYTGIVDCVFKMAGTEGLSSFYRSYRTTLVMNIPYQMIHFGIYEGAKKVLLEPAWQWSGKGPAGSGGGASGSGGRLTLLFCWWCCTKLGQSSRGDACCCLVLGVQG